MRMIITHEGITLNTDIIAMIQSVFVDISDYDVIDNINDDEHVVYEDVEFGILAVTTLNDEILLGVYATEEERDFAKYKLENWLASDFSNYYKMTERK